MVQTTEPRRYSVHARHVHTHHARTLEELPACLGRRLKLA